MLLFAAFTTLTIILSRSLGLGLLVNSEISTENPDCQFEVFNTSGANPTTYGCVFSAGTCAIRLVPCLCGNKTFVIKATADIYHSCLGGDSLPGENMNESAVAVAWLFVNDTCVKNGVALLNNGLVSTLSPTPTGCSSSIPTSTNKPISSQISEQQVGLLYVLIALLSSLLSIVQICWI